MSFNAIWHATQAAITGIGAALAAYLGGLNSLAYALIVFTIADYITGVLAAINERRLSSAVGFRGISRKILIFILVGLAHLIDVHILGAPGVLRAAVIFFYLSNEGISLIENATRLGLPIPPQMRGALDAIANHAQTRPPLTKPTKDNSTEKENQS
ncbi:phage holin family protein [Gleimia hominis]|uniref:Phage holin family protein n=1 Tax=Gleimia hominis TaxID=595468 RepID=A0ABU3ICZ3_9ACTO|nr:phage holin family protein [Gleimia hominis]MDT3768153.1 phage holin family protein [Gleimia hominis]